MTVRLVALGDSLSCGEGVGLRVPLADTWPARLAACVDGGSLLPLAAPGARVRDVLAGQVDAAAAADRHVVTLLIGLNDISRAGFEVPSFAADLRGVLDRLVPTGAHVLLGRLHDAASLVPLPARLRRVVQDRTDRVNEVVDAEVAADPRRVHVLDLASIAGLRNRRSWDVDRLHPNADGHALIAASAAGLVGALGLPVRRSSTPVLPAAPGPVAEVRWLLRSGLPWLAGHVPQVVLPALAAGVRR